MYRIRCLLFGFLYSVVLLIAGCGGPKLCPVKGKVVFPDGQPLMGGRVVFETTAVTPPVSAQGEIQSDGTFVLGTYKPGDGVLKGKHRALVSPPLPKNLERQGPSVIHPRFRNFNSSGLEFNVSSTASNNFTIEVTP